MRNFVITSAVALLLAMTASRALAQGTTHKYKPTAGVQTFAVRPPVLTVKPGDRSRRETFTRPGDYYDPTRPGPWPGEVGPIHIEGAAPGDTLVVRILGCARIATSRSRTSHQTASAAWPATAARAC